MMEEILSELKPEIHNKCIEIKQKRREKRIQIIISIIMIILLFIPSIFILFNISLYYILMIALIFFMIILFINLPRLLIIEERKMHYE